MKAQIEIFSRIQSRKSQFSTIQVRRMLIKAGFKDCLVSEPTAIIQRIIISGTRKEILEARHVINLKMHTIALHGQVAVGAQSFKLLES